MKGFLLHMHSWFYRITLFFFIKDKLNSTIANVAKCFILCCISCKDYILHVSIYFSDTWCLFYLKITDKFDWNKKKYIGINKGMKNCRSNRVNLKEFATS